MAMDKDFDLRAISLGAGVQSSAMYLMAATGVLTPRPNVAIFADTQSEPPWVYEHLDFLERNFGHLIPIHRATSGSLEKNLYWGGEGRKGFAQIPAFLKGAERDGIGRRQCTFQYKIRPIERACRELLGLKKGQRAAGRYRVEQWIGISTDEAHRAKPSDVRWIERRYPLLFDHPMRRGECLQWVEKNGFPKPKKSSCFFCPYHHDREWLDLKRNAPELWERACQIDDDLRSGKMESAQEMKGEQYLHAARVPLRVVALKNENQTDLWGNECEGVCGV